MRRPRCRSIVSMASWTASGNWLGLILLGCCSLAANAQVNMVPMMGLLDLGLDVSHRRLISSYASPHMCVDNDLLFRVQQVDEMFLLNQLFNQKVCHQWIPIVFFVISHRIKNCLTGSVGKWLRAQRVLARQSAGAVSCRRSMSLKRARQPAVPVAFSSPRCCRAALSQDRA